jgi:3-oxoacyl-[acyl-carrier protein] reductase
MLSIDLRGRLAVVTGASGELGRAMSRTLADCGADLAVCYHTAQEKAEALAAEIRQRGVRSIAVQADITNEASIMSMRDQVQRELGDADIIVNNAVIQCMPWKTVLEQPLHDYETQFQSCVMHNVLMARAFVPGMIRKKKGRVIGINTECAMRVFATESAYVSGKRGMDGVLRVLAKEVGEHGITVNQIAPGWTISERDRTNHTEQNEGYDKTVPLRHRGEDRDIANMVAFLASDLAAFVTGQYIAVSGGTIMPCI